MSTRANIIIKLGDTRIYLYRHCDGYPGELGADLAQKVQAAYGTAESHYSESAMADRLVRALLGEMYDASDFRPARPVYEITNGLHGDIEHAYTVDIAQHFNTGPFSIRHAARPKSWYDEKIEVDDWANAGKRYDLDGFRALVNADRDSMNTRIRQLKREQPGAYGDAEEYAHI